MPVCLCQQRTDFFVRPVMQNSSNRVQVGRWKVVFEKVAFHHLDPIAGLRKRHLFPSKAGDSREIEHYPAQPGITLAQGDDQVSGGSRSEEHTSELPSPMY